MSRGCRFSFAAANHSFLIASIMAQAFLLGVFISRYQIRFPPIAFVNTSPDVANLIVAQGINESLKFSSRNHSPSAKRCTHP
jgi:hypothetical protein